MSLRGEPLWAEVRIGLEILEAGTAQPRVCVLNQPFAVIGRLADSHIQIDDRAVSALHAYLHADVRAVRRRSRHQDRHSVRRQSCSLWLGSTRQHDRNRRYFIRLTHFEIQGHQTPLPSGSASLLDATEQDLRGLSLDPVGRRYFLDAEIREPAFIGRSDSCGIRLNQANVARTHCVLFSNRYLRLSGRSPRPPNPGRRRNCPASHVTAKWQHHQHRSDSLHRVHRAAIHNSRWHKAGPRTRRAG